MGFLVVKRLLDQLLLLKNQTIEKCIPTHANPVLLTLYGHRLAAGGSFSAAQCTPPFSITVLIVAYYFRAREFVKDDALLELSIGLAYLHDQCNDKLIIDTFQWSSSHDIHFPILSTSIHQVAELRRGRQEQQ